MVTLDQDLPLRTRIWIQVSRLLAVARWIDEKGPRPDTNPGGWSQLQPVLDVCYDLVMRYTDKQPGSGMWSPLGDLLEFGSNRGVITEARQTIIQPLQRAIRAVPQPTGPAGYWLQPLVGELTDTVRYLDDTAQAIIADRAAHLAALPGRNAA